MFEAAASLALTGGVVLQSDGEFVIRDLGVTTSGIDDGSAQSERRARLNCEGLYVLPGIIDVHGDAFEREVAPRPGVAFNHAIALKSVDRQLIAHGITTAFHGLTVTWEPGERSLDAAQAFMAGLSGLGDQLHADHRVQIRWETFAFEAMDLVAEWLASDRKPALAFNDHTTATMRKVAAGEHKKLGVWASRAGLTPEAYLAMVEQMAARASDVPAAIAKMAAAARAAGTVMLGHDEISLDERERHRALGLRVCEFPLVREVALDARSQGEDTVLGAPNVVRGGSHTGALDARDAIRDGLCSVLASDYYYPSLLAAAGRLVAENVCDRAAAWALISANPARAMGLEDRGVLAEGRRADVLAVDWSQDAAPSIVAVIANGELRWISEPARLEVA